MNESIGSPIPTPWFFASTKQSVTFPTGDVTVSVLNIPIFLVLKTVMPKFKLTRSPGAVEKPFRSSQTLLEMLGDPNSFPPKMKGNEEELLKHRSFVASSQK
jgi:hypothetical protein